MENNCQQQVHLLAQANSSDSSAQSEIPSQCFPSGMQLASDQQVNCVCVQPADNDRELLAVSSVDSLCKVLIVVDDVTVDGILRPSSTMKLPLLYIQALTHNVLTQSDQILIKQSLEDAASLRCPRTTFSVD